MTLTLTMENLKESDNMTHSTTILRMFKTISAMATHTLAEKQFMPEYQSQLMLVEG